MNKVIPIFMITLIFLPVYSSQSFVSASREFGSANGIDWNRACLLVEPALYKSCNAYVDNNGDLTVEGERAFGCIRNGAIIAGGALAVNPLLAPFIGKGLDFLDDLTGCGGIVNFDALDKLDIQFILDLLK